MSHPSILPNGLPCRCPICTPVVTLQIQTYESDFFGIPFGDAHVQWYHRGWFGRKLLMWKFERKLRRVWRGGKKIGDL